MVDNKKQPAKAPTEKSEFLTELVNGYSYWMGKGNEEYAKAYERLIFAFTQPETKQP